MTAWRQPIKPGDVGLDVWAVKGPLIRRFGGHKINRTGKGARRAGAAFVRTVKAIQADHKLKVDGVVGPSTFPIIEPYLNLYERKLYAKAKLRPHSRQVPALPRVFFRPLGVGLPGRGKWGLQPWIVPQVEAICKEFGLSVSDGYGGTPPHASRSDHKWGGAVDLAGPLENMRRCNEWADGLRGHTFRWVGGPAHDADGVEHGHGDHVHLSWKFWVATTIFGTSRFK